MFRTVSVTILIVVATAAVYWQVRDFEFIVFDDPIYVYNNPHVNTGLTQQNAAWAFKVHGPSQWIPLTWLSHQLVWELAGDDPAWHHAANVLLHVLSAVLLFHFLRYTGGSFWPAALVGALFALHPLHVESVAWVTERKDTLCGLFWMLTLCAYAAYARNGGRGRYLAVLGCCLMAAMAKPLAVTLPAVLLLLDYWPMDRVAKRSGLRRDEPDWQFAPRPVRRLLLEKVPLLGISVAASVLTVLCQVRAGAIQSLDASPLSFRVANAIVAYATYLRKAVWPCDLAPFYPYPKSFGVWQVAAASFVLLVITALAVVAVGRRRYLLVGWLWYLGTMLPMIGLVQATAACMADRYAYVPMIGVYVMVAFGLGDLAARARPAAMAAAAAAVVSLAACLGATWFQAGLWRNSRLLFEHTLRVTSDNVAAHNNLGMALYEEGDTPGARHQFEQALRIRPNFRHALHNLAILHFSLGIQRMRQNELQQAAEHFTRTLQIEPDHPEATRGLEKIEQLRRKQGSP